MRSADFAHERYLEAHGTSQLFVSGIGMLLVMEVSYIRPVRETVRSGCKPGYK